MHRDLVKSLRAFVGHNPKTWCRYLPAVLMALRSTVSSATGYTPSQLVYGRELRLPIDIQFGCPTDEPEIQQPVTQYSQDLRRRLQQAFAYTRKNIGLAIARQRNNYFKAKEEFAVGDRVWLFSPRAPSGPRKLAVYYTGPWTVQKVVNPVTFVIAPSPNWQRKTEEVVSIDRLRRFITADGEPKPNIAPSLNQACQCPATSSPK